MKVLSCFTVKDGTGQKSIAQTILVQCGAF